HLAAQPLRDGDGERALPRRRGAEDREDPARRGHQGAPLPPPRPTRRGLRSPSANESAKSPSRSVLNVLTRAERRRSRTSLDGGPYVFGRPTPISATRGATALRTSAVVDVRLPWCGTLRTSARRPPRETRSRSAGASTSPVRRTRRPPRRAARTS